MINSSWADRPITSSLKTPSMLHHQSLCSVQPRRYLIQVPPSHHLEFLLIFSSAAPSPYLQQSSLNSCPSHLQLSTHNAVRAKSKMLSHLVNLNLKGKPPWVVNDNYLHFELLPSGRHYRQKEATQQYPVNSATPEKEYPDRFSEIKAAMIRIYKQINFHCYIVYPASFVFMWSESHYWVITVTVQ